MILEHKDFPYKFDATVCSTCAGNCCIGESGVIWITIDEIEKLATHLNISVKEVFDNYLIKYDYKFSIKEKKLDENNYACIFFDLTKKQCSIYEARPSQCRTFPFWDHFKNNIEEVKQECPAILE
ncbi:MAG: YkgJ family cysteine cluster protein [Arcobacteraceae bacterium]|jgi:Fe-S-cluster containining protein|nr:YkgJ family cysteine cluster protein [Arcobacteraceae bacterium]